MCNRPNPTEDPQGCDPLNALHIEEETMHEGALGSRFAISTALLLGLLLSNSAFADAGGKPANAIGSMGPVPKAQCGPSDRTESGLQGQTTSKERASGDSPDSQAKHACRQAEIPLSALFRIPKPSHSPAATTSRRRPSGSDILFGLADLGFGAPELGSFSLFEMESLRLPFGMGIERDLYFEAAFPLSVYTEAARLAGQIVVNEQLLRAATASLGQGP
jgi:hypothetical protein